MFDFAFSEIALIGVVALVVIGPERLPRVARTAGVVVGRLQRYASSVKADIAREVELSELRRVQGDIQDAARSFETGVRDSLAAAESHFDQGRQALMSGAQAVTDGSGRGTAEPGSAAPVWIPDPATERPEPQRAPPPQASLFDPRDVPPGDSAERPADRA